MPVDMKTIAERVGVSKTTVHRALNNVGRISPETREKIIKVAAELDYRPNNLARGLRSQKSVTLGLVVIGLTNSFYSTILEGVENVATESGYSVLIARTMGSIKREIKHLELLREKRVDGIIIAPAHPVDNAFQYEKLRDTGIQFVFIDRIVPSIEADYVMTDSYMGAYLAGKHLIARGRKKMAVAVLPGSEMISTAATERLRGLTSAMAEAGLEPPEWIGQGMPLITPPEAFASAALEKYIKNGGEVDGIFAINDSVAIGTISGLKNMGLSVPGDVSVVGFDDLDIAPYIQPPLTTLRQPSRDIGENAVRLLLNRIENPSAPYKHLLLPPKLIVRESCGMTEVKARQC